METNFNTYNFDNIDDLRRAFEDPRFLAPPPAAAEPYSNENTKRMDWTMFHAGQKSSTIFGRVHCSLGVLEDKDPQYRFYTEKHRYLVLLPKGTFDAQSEVNFQIRVQAYGQQLAKISTDDLSSKAWDIYPIEFSSVNRSLVGNKPVSLLLIQGQRELRSEEVHIYKINHNLPSVSRPIYLSGTIDTSNSEPLLFKNISNNNNNASNASDQPIVMRVHSTKEKIEKHPAMELLQFYQRSHDYLLLIPKGTFDPNLEVGLELQNRESEQIYPHSQLPKPVASTSSEWDIYTFNFAFLPFKLKNFTKQESKAFALLLSQGAKRFISDPIIIYVERAKRKVQDPEEIDPAILNQLISDKELPKQETPSRWLTQSYALQPGEPDPFSKFSTQQERCGLLWEDNLKGTMVYVPIQCREGQLSRSSSSVPTLYKSAKYSLLMPHGHFDASKPVQFGIQFKGTIYSMPAVEQNAIDAEKWDVYPIDISKFLYSSGNSKKSMRFVLSQDEKTLTSHVLFINSFSQKKQKN